MTAAEHDYRILPRSRLQEGDLTLRALGPKDIEPIRLWRNAQMNVLRQSEAITPVAQQRYFAEQIWPDKQSAKPTQILLAIDQGSRLVGYGGLVHIAWHDRRAEVSFLLEPQLEREHPVRAALFTRFLQLLQELAFVDLGLSRLWTETYVHRTTHLETLETVGFRLEGRLRAHVIIEGKPSDCLLHGLLAHEWKKQK